MSKYVIGTDFGTLSGRSVLVDALTGEQIADAVYTYPHAVMDRCLPSGRPLPQDYALQHPKDYIDVLRYTVREVMKKGGVAAEDVVGYGIDFTACTLLPVDEEGTPLCMKAEYENEPHAYVKLWKHHAAQSYANELNELAVSRKEKWLSACGGNLSCEAALPKILQVLREAPHIYERTARFIEAGDWVTSMITGDEVHSASFALFKATWSSESGYPSNEFLTSLDAGLSGIAGTKLSEKVRGIDEVAGYVSEVGAELTGLMAGTPVSMPLIDAHVTMPALDVTGNGDIVLVIGTSSAHLLNFDLQKDVSGIFCCIKDGVIPGFYTYEAAQAAVGDMFDWFTKNCVPESYEQEARQKGIGIHKLLREKAMKLRAGESGLLALDWWNGNRSILSDSDLTGMILGMTLSTRPEEIYRALIEATAFGLRVILENYEATGVRVDKVCAAGGISKKDEMLMQIYSDVLKKEISVSSASELGALGSSCYAAVAAGVYKDIREAARNMCAEVSKVYRPDSESSETYDLLYDEYKALHDYFGKENNVMKRLKKLREN